MIALIPTEITIASFSLLGCFTAYIWNSQNKRITDLEDDIEKCPFPKFGEDISKMKNDIEWIKKFLDK